MQSFDQAIHQLPQPILDKLQSLIDRIRRLTLIRGIFATLAVALVAILMIMAIDASVTLFSRSARWALSLMGLGATLAAAWWFLLRPLSRKLTLTQVARYLEIQHPELQERISTAVELMSSDDPDSVRGSEELINAVVDSAVVDVAKFDPETEFKPVKANRFMKAAAAAFALILVLFVIWPSQIGILLSRAVAPFLDVGNAWAETIEVDPGDLRVAVGDKVTITMTVDQKRLRRADLRRLLPDGKTESVERMTLLGEDEDGRKRFSMTFPSVGESFSYRVTAGSGVSEFYDITAVSRPIVESLSVRYDYPSYTQRDSVEQPIETGEIRALVNTEVTLTAVLNKPVTAATIAINDVKKLPQPAELANGASANTLTWKFPLEKSMNGTWEMRALDSDEFENEIETYSIAALPDRAPVVQIQTPVARELRLKPTELLPIQYRVQEDYGFTEMAILATPNGSQIPEVLIQATPTPSIDNRPGEWQGTASLNLAALDLEGKNRITVQLRASDNLPERFDGAQQGLSDTITILIDRNAKSLTQQTIEEQRKTLEKAIREAKSELERAKNETREAERDLSQNDKLSEAQKDLQEFQEDAQKAQEKLRETAEALANSVFNKQADKLETVADEEVASAREKADLIPVLEEKEQRVAEVRETRKEIEDAIKDLTDIERSINETAQEAKMLAELNDLANDQRELAQKADAQAENAQREANEKKQEQDLARWQQEQEKVQKELGEMLKENKEAFAEVLKKQQAEAEALAEKTQKLADSQEQNKQMTQQATEAEQQEALKDALLAALKEDQKQIAQETQAMQQQAAQQAQKESSQPDSATEMAQNETSLPNEPSADEDTQTDPTSSEPSTPETSTAQAEAASDPAEASETSPTEQSSAAEQAQQQALAEASAQTENAAEKTDSAASEETAESIQSAAEAASEAQESLAEAASQAEAAAQEQSQQAAANQASPENPASSPQASQEARAKADAASAEAQATTELAQRQESVAEQLAAVAAGDLDAALEMREAQIQAEASALQTAAESLEQATETAQAWNSKGQADQAENALSQATQQATQAGQELAKAQQSQAQAEQQGKAEPGQPSKQAQQQLQQSQNRQQQAAQSMQQAANALRQSAQLLAQEAQKASQQASQEAQQNAQKGEDGPPMDSQQLADSFEDVSDAASAQSAEHASQQSQQAAESLQQLAQQAMQQMGMGGQPGQGSESQGQQVEPTDEISEIAEGSPQLNEGGKSVAQLNGDGIPPELEAMGMTVADWIKVRGALTSGSTSNGPDDVSPEYRELVGRYFRVIASEAK